MEQKYPYKNLHELVETLSFEKTYMGIFTRDFMQTKYPTFAKISQVQYAVDKHDWEKRTRSEER